MYVLLHHGLQCFLSAPKVWRKALHADSSDVARALASCVRRFISKSQDVVDISMLKQALGKEPLGQHEVPVPLVAGLRDAPTTAASVRGQAAMQLVAVRCLCGKALPAHGPMLTCI